MVDSGRTGVDREQDRNEPKTGLSTSTLDCHREEEGRDIDTRELDPERTNTTSPGTSCEYGSEHVGSSSPSSRVVLF